MAKLLEYRGKEILRQFGIPTPVGQVISQVEEAQKVVVDLNYPLAVKAQVYAGKRGKAGGVRIVNNEAEMMTAVSELFSSSIRGLEVEMLLIEEKADVQQEIYVGVTADPSARTPVLIVCAEGGVDIEEVAEKNPNAILRLPVDILRGVFIHDALGFLSDLSGFTSRQKLQVAQILCSLYEVYREYDCKLIEINPLALTDSGVVALDARVDIDGDAMSRHADLGIDVAEEAGERGSTLLEQIAGTIDHGDHRGTVHFVQIDPDMSYINEHDFIPIGFDCVGAGASLTMMDELVPLGFYPVNFCDSSGNPVASKLYRITKVIFSQPGIEGYVFVSCVSSQQLDNTARGIIKALKELYPSTGGQPNIPTLLCFRGAWDEDAIQLLSDQGISSGHWVRVLGRDVTERDAAMTFQTLYQEWKGSQGDNQ